MSDFDKIQAEVTPMMAQYIETKKEYNDCILFYRLGDFYEMFFEDAITVSKELELTLTGKSCGLEERAPMCGVPFHAADVYINRLVARGYKVAICEQVEDPKEAKGLVKREVIRVVTPGTNIDSMALDEGKNNYIMSLYYGRKVYGIACCDVTTGVFLVSEIKDANALYDEVIRLCPAEIVYHKNVTDTEANLGLLRERINVVLSEIDTSYYNETLSVRELLNHFKSSSVEGLGLADFGTGAISAGALLTYLRETQKSDLSQINQITTYTDANFMLIDSATRRNLELTETMRDKSKRGSLLWVLDKTKTAMGARTLKSYVEQPLVSVNEIIRRQDAVEELKNNVFIREELREYLNPVYDLERLVTKITYQTANPRDLIAFKQSISMLTPIKTLLMDCKTGLIGRLNDDIDTLYDLHRLIDDAILDEPPISSRDGDIIKPGYSEEIDRLRNAKVEGKTWLADLEASEREKTGIKNLKVKYNKVFGYYFEVTNSYKDLVPDYFIRKQTLANAERYYTDELKNLEDTIIGAEERLNVIEYESFKTVRDTIASCVVTIQTTARALSHLDAILSLAQVADANRYVRPEINNRGIIDIKEGRHPVVEKLVDNDSFITNDTYLDKDENYISIITGPNMAGKSTYMRQVALIVLMAQIGSFVPADSANIGIVDRIFTRVGASDDLSTGQSTFMVEMNEVSNILRHATEKSLLILDEIGRGTSTYDGLAIAWAVAEFISDKNKLGAKTLFATHYHELTELEGQLPGVHNFCIAVKEVDDNIIFLRKIIKGGADKSYGIQVAKLAGLPDAVIDRAKIIVESLAQADITDVHVRIKENEKLAASMPVSSVSDAELELINTVKKLNVENVTPLEALTILYDLKDKINGNN